MSRSFRNNSRNLPNQPKKESLERVRFQENISEAETSEDDHGAKIIDVRARSQERKDSYSHITKYKKDCEKGQESHSDFRSPSKLDTSQSSTTRHSSLTRNSSAKFTNTEKDKTLNKNDNKPLNKKPSYFHSSSQTTKPPNEKNTIIVEDDNKSDNGSVEIMRKINSMDLLGSNYMVLKSEFIKNCGNHVRFLGKTPEAITGLGEELLKNGEFHSKWIGILKLQENIDLKPLLESYYVLYKEKIKKNIDEFEGVLGISEDGRKIKEEMKGVCDDSEASIQLKRYRSLIDEEQQYLYQRERNYKLSSQHHYHRNQESSSSRSLSTTKFDTMLLYQQLKEELRIEEIEQNITNTVQKTIEEWKLKTSELEKSNHEQFQPICDTDLMFENEQSILEKWNDIEELEKRKEAIEQLEKQRVRERSPLSNRFRMMHECQTNARRMQVEMACMFLSCESFYYMQDLEILNVEETIFSDTQEIVVLKAYAVEFDPKVGMMKLEPKIKTLISVYKFCGLSELIRLEKTYGKFDGIVVYPESFDIKKYLANNKDLSLMKERFLREVKGQLPENEERREIAERSDGKIEY